MKEGTYYFRGYVVSITSETKLEDINYIIKKHPEFKEIVGIKDDNSKQKRKPRPDNKNKS